MAASDAIPVPRKNTAFRYYFAIRKPSDSTLITSWTGADSEVSLDGGAFSDCTNESTEIGTSGCGYIDLTSGEMNADAVMLKVTITNSGAVPLVFVLYPESAGDYRVADTQKVDVDTIKTNPVVNGGTITFPSGATLASTTGAVGSVTGNVGGNVTGSVGSVVGLTASNLDVASSTLATAANLAIVAGYLDTEIAAIKAKTDNLPSDPADASDIAASFSTVNTKLDTIDDFIDTEVAAIKAKTDQLTFNGSNVLSDLRAISTAPVAVDTGTAGTVSFISGEYVMTTGSTVSANVTQVDGENVQNDGNGRLQVDAVSIAGDDSAATAASAFWHGAILDSGTAQDGSSATLTLRAGSSASDDFYKNSVVVLTGGTGSGQNRKITGYVGSTKVATVSGDRNWTTSPDDTTTYVILGNIP